MGKTLDNARFIVLFFICVPVGAFSVLYFIENTVTLSAEYAPQQLSQTALSLQPASSKIIDPEQQQQIEYWKQLADLYPNYRDAHLQVAYLAYITDNLDEATLYLTKAQSIDPNYPPIQELVRLLQRGNE